MLVLVLNYDRLSNKTYVSDMLCHANADSPNILQNTILNQYREEKNGKWASMQFFLRKSM